MPTPNFSLPEAIAILDRKIASARAKTEIAAEGIEARFEWIEPVLQAAKSVAAGQTGGADPASTSEGWEWAVVEIFGHRRHAGRTREEERFGSKMLRIDIPVKGDPSTHGWETHYYGGAAIFSFALSDEATVMKANKPYESPYRLTYRDDDPGEDAEDAFDGVEHNDSPEVRS